MILNNINLMSDEQLFRIGLSKHDVETVKHNSPIESVLNLFGLGIDIEKVRRLLSFGVIGSILDLPHVSIDDGHTITHHQCGSGEQLDLPEQTGRKGNLEVLFHSCLEDVFLFQGFLFPGDITPMEGTTFGPFIDCTTTKRFKVDAKGRETVQITTTNPGLFPQFKQMSEDEAARRAIKSFFSTVAALVAKCPCTNPNCLTPRITVTGPTTRILNPDDPPMGIGFRRSAVATGQVEIACLTLV